MSITKNQVTSVAEKQLHGCERSQRQSDKLKVAKEDNRTLRFRFEAQKAAAPIKACSLF